MGVVERKEKAPWRVFIWKCDVCDKEMQIFVAGPGPEGVRLPVQGWKHARRPFKSAFDDPLDQDYVIVCGEECAVTMTRQAFRE